MNDASPNRSGLDLLKGLIASWHATGMSGLLHLRLIEVADGLALFEAHPTAEFYNPQNRVHGGYAATLIDSAMGCAVQTKLPAGTGYGTVEMKVSFVRKIDVSSGRLLCTATVLHAGRTMLTADARVMDAHGRLCAHGSGTFLVYPT